MLDTVTSHPHKIKPLSLSVIANHINITQHILLAQELVTIKKITQTAVINIVLQRIFIDNLTFRMLVNIHFQK